jgi:hypothetical protein
MMNYGQTLFVFLIIFLISMPFSVLGMLFSEGAVVEQRETLWGSDGYNHFQTVIVPPDDVSGCSLKVTREGPGFLQTTTIEIVSLDCSGNVLSTSNVVESVQWNANSDGDFQLITSKDYQSLDMLLAYDNPSVFQFPIFLNCCCLSFFGALSTFSMLYIAMRNEDAVATFVIEDEPGSSS